MEIILEAMKELSSKERMVIQLRYFKGTNYDGIADALKISENSAKNEVKDAVKSLKKLVDEIKRKN